MTDHSHFEPCRHVSKYVEAQAHGRPRRWWNFFGWLHVKNCPQCQEALRRLTNYFLTLNPGGSEDMDPDILKLSQTLTEKIRSETPD